ncbi:MAG TPA: hypothetical protein DDW50_19330 [Firmicutes bacterium]|jgi:spore germination protein KA|nr:hypothetical protein [Bacillota bacterium]
MEHSFGPAEESLSPRLRQNLTKINELLAKSPDLIIRRFMIQVNHQSWEAAIIFIDGLVDTKVIENHILRPLMVDGFKMKSDGPGIFGSNVRKDFGWIENHLLTVNSLVHQSTFDEVLNAILSRDTVLLAEGIAEGFQISSKGWEHRSIEEPDTEVTIKGAREGFIESLRTNTALLRRKVGHPHLTFEGMQVGRKSKTNLSLAYIRGLTDEDLLKEVRRRISRIDTESILDAVFWNSTLRTPLYHCFPL